MRQPHRAVPDEDAGRGAANVNLATERATVLVDPGIAGRDELVKAVEAAGYEVKAEAVAVEARAPRPRLEAEITADDVEREREQRHTLFQALVSIGAALVFMVLMFVPQTVVPMTETQQADPVAGDVHPVLGGRPLLPRRLAGRHATAGRRWTRSSPSARARPGATACS